MNSKTLFRLVKFNSERKRYERVVQLDFLTAEDARLYVANVKKDWHGVCVQEFLFKRDLKDVLKRVYTGSRFKNAVYRVSNTES